MHEHIGRREREQQIHAHNKAKSVEEHERFELGRSEELEVKDGLDHLLQLLDAGRDEALDCDHQIYLVRDDLDEEVRLSLRLLRIRDQLVVDLVQSIHGVRVKLAPEDLLVRPILRSASLQELELILLQEADDLRLALDVTMGGLDVVEARLRLSAQVIDRRVPGHARVPNCDRQVCLVQDALVELDQEADELRVLHHQVADDLRLALNVTMGKLDVLDARLLP
mmetsp:Transcript_3878/g.10435  ORF Transcript_3878/g.10435 Transcript_3878/m.10435 type:complete len:224 (-) Transcript_3878:96-767(-)